MSGVKVKDSHGEEHLIQKAALEGNFAGHGFTVIDEKPTHKKSANKQSTKNTQSNEK